MLNHSANGCRVEQIWIVCDWPAEALAAIVDDNHQVQLRPAVAYFLRRQIPAWCDGGQSGLLGEDDLKQRIAAGIRFPATLSQSFSKRQVFVLQGVQHYGPHS